MMYLLLYDVLTFVWCTYFCMMYLILYDVLNFVWCTYFCMKYLLLYDVLTLVWCTYFCMMYLLLYEVLTFVWCTYFCMIYLLVYDLLTNLFTYIIITICFINWLLTKTLSFMMIGNQRLQRHFDGLLMMVIIMPETCWAVSVRQSNKILRLIVASSWVFYLGDTVASS